MERKDLAVKLAALETELKTLKATTYEYNITRGFNQFKRPAEIETSAELVNAIYFIDCNVKRREALDLIVERYGISDIVPGEDTYYGYTREEFESDFKTRITELKNIQRISELHQAINVMTGYLSDEDKFSRAMESISDII